MSGVAEPHFGSLLALGRPDGGPKLSLAGFAFSLVGRRQKKYSSYLYEKWMEQTRFGAGQAWTEEGKHEKNEPGTARAPPNQDSQSLFSLRVSGGI